MGQIYMETVQILWKFLSNAYTQYGRWTNEFQISYIQFIFEGMSEQEGGLLQTRGSYDFKRTGNNNYRSQSIDSNKFTSWQAGNMYKSSYAHFHSGDSVQPKKAFIPGYAGYVPSVKADSLYGKSFTPIAKASLANEKLGTNQFGLSTNGFNITKQCFLDGSKLAGSSKYGKTAIQKSHPAWNESWRTTTQEAFKDPNSQPNPIFRPTDKFVQTSKDFTRNSGFATNYSCQDGKGWVPDRALKGDLNRSEYRDRFNPKPDFHRDTDYWKERKLKAKETNYKFN